jgi:large subunit ribosomal protein L6
MTQSTKQAVKHEDKVEFPENIQASFDKHILTIKGEKGEVIRNIANPLVQYKINDKELLMVAKTYNKRTKKIINTLKAHIKNMIRGVQEGHIYKLKICSGHFPMTVTLKGDVFEVKNFIGEKIPRRVKVLEGTQVKIDGTEVTVESISKEKAGTMAAAIEQLCRRPGFDQRIFQDGIYITMKDGKELK